MKRASDKRMESGGARTWRKLASCFMALVFAFGMIPTAAYAAAGESLRAASSPALDAAQIGVEGAEESAEADGPASDGSAADDSLEATDQMSVVYDSYVNDAFVDDGANGGSVIEESRLAGNVGDDWEVATDGDEATPLSAPTFNPMDYGDFRTRAAAVDYVTERLMARDPMVLVAVEDEVGMQGSLARSVVETAFAEPATLSGAGDYLYWHVREWTSSTIYAATGKLYYVKYNVVYNDDSDKEAWVTSEVESVVSGLSLDDMTTAEKVVAIHDYVVENVAYDWAHESDSEYRAQYTAYGALHDKAAVCQGFATLYYRLCKEAGVSCRIVSGLGGLAGDYGSHGWNIVEIDGAWYCVDCTWDSNLLSQGKAQAYRTYLLKVGDDFTGHFPDDAFKTAEFQAAYPMAESSYVLPVEAPQVTVEAGAINEYGDMATFTATAAGFAEDAVLSYKWEWSADGTNWSSVPSSYVGAMTQELQVKVASATSPSNRKFRCVVSAGAESATSDSTDIAWKPLTAEVAQVSTVEGVASPDDLAGGVKTATFEVTNASVSAASLTGFTWQQSPDGIEWEDVPASVAGARSSSMTIACTPDNANYRFRCKVQAVGTRAKCETEAVQFDFGLYASVAPAHVLGYGDTGTFYASTRAAEEASVSYRWQYREGAEASWADCPSSVEGASAQELTVPFGSEVRNREYRCILTDGALGHTYTTNAAAFALKQHVDISVSTTPIVGYGRAASFTVHTDIDSVPGAVSSRTWQWSRDAATWTTVPVLFSGWNGERLDVPASWVRKGFYYRCEVKAADGRSAVSGSSVSESDSNTNTFELQTLEASAVMSNLAADKTATVTAVTSLDGAEGMGLNYRWQRSSDGVTWVDCDVADYPGAWSSEMQVIYPASGTPDQYRCTVVAPDGRGAVTDAVGFNLPELSVRAEATVADINEESELSCEVSGITPTENAEQPFAVYYQWQVKDPITGNWDDLEGDEGEVDDTKLPVSHLVIEDVAYYKVAFRCHVETEDGRKMDSNTVYVPSPDYGELIVDVSTGEVLLGEKAVMKCTLDRGESKDLLFGLKESTVSKYKWFNSSDDGETWQECANEGAETSELSVIANESTLDMQYRCEVTDSSGSQTVSKPIQVKVDDLVATVSTSEVNLGDQATLTCKVVNAESATLGYQWQRSTDAIEWEEVEGATSASYTLVATAEAMKYRYRCVVSDASLDYSYWATDAIALQVASVIDISYKAHVQNIGWMSAVKNGAMAGTTGRALQLEAVQIQIEGAPASALTYRAHVRDIGWQQWVTAGGTAGTTGRALRMEAIEIKLTGEYAKLYDVYYRTHVSNVGWLGWAKNGATSGSEGMRLSAEAIEVRVVPKGESFDVGGSAVAEKPKLTYQAHVADIGWQSSVGEASTAGTTGKNKGIEALKLNMTDINGSGSGIAIRAHVRDEGWQSFYAHSGQVSGTTGKARPIECVVIQLLGSAAQVYDVYYHVHVQNMGWLGWTKNNGWAGTTGRALQIEAIEIKLIPKGQGGTDSNPAYYPPPDPEPQPAMSDYDRKVNEFINDPRWCNGASWGSRSSYLLPGAGSQCYGYVIDFINYVFDESNPSGGVPFGNPSEIRAGDVIHVNGTGGKSGHWFAVLHRDGDILHTAEGNWTGGRVCVGYGEYTVSGNTLLRNGSKFRAFTTSYHFM